VPPPANELMTPAARAEAHSRTYVCGPDIPISLRTSGKGGQIWQPELATPWPLSWPPDPDYRNWLVPHMLHRY
jgi:hypothetical protein